VGGTGEEVGVKMRIQRDVDVRPSRVAVELGLTEAEARELRRQVEYVEIAAPQRWVRGERIVIARRESAT